MGLGVVLISLDIGKTIYGLNIYGPYIDRVKY